MKNIPKIICCAVLSACLAAGSAVPFFAASAMPVEVVSVELGDNGYENFNILTAALYRADSERELVVRIAAPGTYTVSSSGRALMMRSNTTLDLGGSTLVRGGGMYNFVQNEDLSGSRDNGGYNQTVNFGIRNGVLDGSGGSSDEVNLVNLGHASNILLENVTFKNCRGGHLVELTGCRDSRITNCAFTGYTGDATGDNEAIQLDICNNSAAGTWNGVYYSDNSVCQNITVDHCEFKDYPAGVGNHHTLFGIHNSGIRITDNTFTNTKSNGENAIWCYGFDNSIVKDNVISGVYTNGIMVSGGSVSVVGNTVKNTSEVPLYVTKSSSYVDGKNKVRDDEPVTGGALIGNTLTPKGSSAALCVYSGSAVSEITGNNITSSKAEGIASSASKIGKIKDNTVKNCGGTGIFLSSSAEVGTVTGNTVTDCGGYGLQINNSNITVSIGGNTLSGNSYGNSKINAATKTVTEPRVLAAPCPTAANVYEGIKVSWKAVSGAVNYRLFFKNKQADSWSRLADTTATAYTHTDVSPGSTYIYTVRPISADGKSYTGTYDLGGALITRVSSPVLAEPEADSSGVTLSWNYVSGASGYRVFYRNESGGWQRLADFFGTEYRDDSLNPGDSRTYTVRALNGSGEYCSGYDPNGVTATVQKAVTPGDVNGDGVVNINDATMLQKAIANIITLTPEQRAAAEVTGDGILNINDVTLIQKHIAGIVRL